MANEDVKSTQLPTAITQGTAQAPTFPQPPNQHNDATILPTPWFTAREQIGDFEIIRTLGEGSFGRVYLARQLSLDREVALKVSPNLGNEARTMASLEHAHIVQVHSETVDANRGLRLLCMQFIPGATLERIITVLNQEPRTKRNGARILEILDAFSSTPIALDAAALSDRESLKACDFAEAVCWLGSRIAQALAYAHSKGVLHRDVKPANILVNRYGRPFLADFNIAATPWMSHSGELFGGTFLYMAPEHLTAYDSRIPAASRSVDHRADIYSLGVVLFELTTGKHPFIDANSTHAASVASPADLHRLPARVQVDSQVPEVFERMLHKALAPATERRYSNASELAIALSGFSGLHRANRSLPPLSALGRLIWQRPLLMLVWFSLLPHLLGSAVNIAYNRLCIADDLDAAQQLWFMRVVLFYNLIVYPICIGLLVRVVAPVFRVWRSLQSLEDVDVPTVATARRAALRLPLWAAAISCFGWLPGGIIFPVAISMLASPVNAIDFAHFVISFTVSGLIAMAYSFFGVQFVVLRCLYPRYWNDASDFQDAAPVELRSQIRRMHGFQVLAGLVPIAGAALLVCSGPMQLTLLFRLLVTSLLVIGSVGFLFAVMLTHRLSSVVHEFGRAHHVPAPRPGREHDRDSRD